MKKNLKKLLIVVVALVLIFPLVKTYALYEGDSTIFVRVPVEHGSYHIQAGEEADDYNGTKRYYVPAGTDVTLRAEPEEGYHLVGWFTFEEEDSDGQGTMTYPTSDEPITVENEYTFRTEQNGHYNLAPVFAEGTVIEEINITGALELEQLEEGELPEYKVNTNTAHITIEPYGSNTGWSRMPNGRTNWEGFGTDTPTAVADRTFYAMRLAIHAEEGYVIKPTTRIIYNNRDMWDTYSSITPFEWGGYVYVDFGQIQEPERPSVEGNVITRVEFEVEMPRIGDKITLVNTDDKFSQTQYGIRINDSDINYYGPNGDDNNNYMFIYDPEKEDLVSGVLEANHTYGMVFYITAFEGYVFAENIDVFINGEYVDTYNFESDTLVGIDYQFEPMPQDVEYTVESEDGNYKVIFTFPEGTDFELDVIDILKYTPEEIEEMFDIPADTITEIINQIKDNIKEYGELISLYSIEINGPGFNYSGNNGDKIIFKMKLTDEMKKYNTFKFLFLDDNNNFEIKEVHDVKIEGDFLVVELDHLSAYALVGSNVEANNTLNPTTGDKIILYAIMLGISIIGLISIGVYTKKKYFAK